MRLLFITQKVDREDSILGVYHEWIRAIAEKTDSVEALCLYKGNYDLPQNVSVHSLGKERGVSSIKYIFNFYKHILSLINKYDVVFVHMNSIYVPLGWILWKLTGKKIVFWYAAYKVFPMTRLALFLSDKGVTSVPEAFNIKSKKIIAIGQGIDTNRFSRNNSIEKGKDSILSLGRISPVKNIDVLIEAMKILNQRNINFNLEIVGESLEGNQLYYDKMVEMTKDLGERVKFTGEIPNYKTPDKYNSNSLFVNLTDSGSFDKTILEAMACESLVLVSNIIYKRIFDEDLKDNLTFEEKNARDLADHIEGLLLLSENEKKDIGQRLRNMVVKGHSLDSLSNKIANLFQD